MIIEMKRKRKKVSGGLPAAIAKKRRQWKLVNVILLPPLFCPEFNQRFCTSEIEIEKMKQAFFEGKVTLETTVFNFIYVNNFFWIRVAQFLDLQIVWEKHCKTFSRFITQLVFFVFSTVVILNSNFNDLLRGSISDPKRAERVRWAWPDLLGLS